MQHHIGFYVVSRTYITALHAILRDAVPSEVHFLTDWYLYLSTDITIYSNRSA